MPITASVITIGNFDGCHVGHVQILRQARLLADQNKARLVVMSFFPHPAAVLRPEYAPSILTNWDQRVSLLEELGADEVVQLKPTAKLLELQPLEFAQLWIAPRSATHIVEGPDFHFGKGRSGNLDVLRVIAEASGFEVVEVGPVRGVLTDNTEVVVSSSLIRNLVKDGRVRDAASLLGRPHRVAGTVIRGDRLGRQIGFPTANVECTTLAPGAGVYAGKALLPDGSSFAAAISMGTRPTVSGHEDRFEVHILDAPTEGERIANLDEYGWDISVEVVGRLRDQIKFGSVDELTEQLRIDCSRVGDALARTISAGAVS
jgi:riboflavin kinase/FMN adenylyltransferase